MDAQPAHPRPVAGQPRERGLLRRPVEAVGPVGDELAQVVEVGAEAPAGVLRGIGPARRPQSRPQIVEGGGVGVGTERLECGIRHAHQPRHGTPGSGGRTAGWGRWTKRTGASGIRRRRRRGYATRSGRTVSPRAWSTATPAGWWSTPSPRVGSGRRSGWRCSSLADHFDLHAVIWVVLVVIAVLPSFAATIVVLSETPRSHLERPESVLAPLLRPLRRLHLRLHRVDDLGRAERHHRRPAAERGQGQRDRDPRDRRGLGAGSGSRRRALPVAGADLPLRLVPLASPRLARAPEAHPAARRASSRAPHVRTRSSSGSRTRPCWRSPGSLAVLLAAGLWVDDVTIHII